MSKNQMSMLNIPWQVNAVNVKRDKCSSRNDTHFKYFKCQGPNIYLQNVKNVKYHKCSKYEIKTVKYVKHAKG